MKKYLLFLISVYVFQIQAQDLDIYKKDINSNFKIPAIPEEMSYMEFKSLSTNIRMQDIGIAMLFPGHIHFKTGEKQTAYYILGARITGYAGLIYMSTKSASAFETVFNNTSGAGEITTSDKIISYGSLLLIGTSFLYDWIHGKYKLEEKQTKIRYKYARKKWQPGLGFIRLKEKFYPGMNIKYTF